MIGSNASGFWIYNECNINIESRSHLGFHGYFELPHGIQENSNESRSYLAGSHQFKVLEIEVFKLE